MEEIAGAGAKARVDVVQEGLGFDRLLNHLRPDGGQFG